MLWNYNACDKFLNELYSEVGMIGQSDCLKCEDQWWLLEQWSSKAHLQCGVVQRGDCRWALLIWTNCVQMRVTARTGVCHFFDLSSFPSSSLPCPNWMNDLCPNPCILKIWVPKLFFSLVKQKSARVFCLFWLSCQLSPSDNFFYRNLYSRDTVLLNPGPRFIQYNIIPWLFSWNFRSLILTSTLGGIPQLLVLRRLSSSCLCIMGTDDFRTLAIFEGAVSFSFKVFSLLYFFMNIKDLDGVGFYSKVLFIKRLANFLWTNDRFSYIYRGIYNFCMGNSVQGLIS